MSPYLHLWAKTAEGDGGPRWHPLAYHLLDVAAVAERLIERDAALAGYAAIQGATHDALARFTLLLVALHDLGKASALFQFCAPEQAARLAALGFSAPTSARAPHGAITATYLTPGVGGEIAEMVAGFAPGVLAQSHARRGLCPTPFTRFLIDPVAGHHGRPVSSASIEGADVNANAPFQAAALALARDLAALFGVAPLPPNFMRDERDGAAFSWFLSSLIPVADWIGSNKNWFPPRAPDLNLDAYWTRIARPAATRAVNEAGLTCIRASRDGAARILPETADPTPLQAHLAQRTLPEGPALFVIEDATGSGKTEAALTLAHRLMAAGVASGFYFALPTTATADAMYARLAPTYRSLFEETLEATPSLSRVHGRAGRLDEDGSVAAWCADWLRDDRRKALMAQASAGTIDQVLMALLPLRYQSLRLFGLRGKVLIVDEVHSFDPYVLRLLEAVLETHAMTGGSVILMSATLPRSTRKRLIEAFRRGRGVEPPARVASDAYPLLTLCESDTVEETGLELSRRSRRTIKVARIESVCAGEAHVMASAQAGCAVALIRSTVDAAIESYLRIAKTLGPDRVTLLHSRFLPEDRLAIERSVLTLFDKRSAPQDRAGRVVVATQVIEQSLDLDFDVLVTDLAPIDLLIQRAGRLWRHARRDRAAVQPVLHVISPDAAQDAEADWLDASVKEACWVYQDPGLLWLTAHALFKAGEVTTATLNDQEAHSGETMSHVRTLVEAVFDTPADALPTLSLRKAREAAQGGDLGRAQLASFGALSPIKGYGANQPAFDSEDRATTRLQTHPRARIRLARDDAGILRPISRGGWTNNEVSVTQNWARDIPAFDRDAFRIEPEWPEIDRDARALVLSPRADGSALSADETIGYDPRLGLHRRRKSDHQ